MRLNFWTGRRPLSRYLVRQYDRTDCGPAALLSVLRFWGGNALLTRVREYAGTDIGGTTFLGLLRAARALGLEARGVTGSYEALMAEQTPCIAHLILDDGTNHYVVCESAGRDKVQVGDPMEGRTTLPRTTFERMWRSRALLLLQPTPAIQKESTPGWLPWFSAYLLREPVWFVQSIFLGGLGALFSIVTALFIQRLIDRLIPAGNAGMILVAGGVLLGILILRAGAEYLRQRFLIRLNLAVSLRLNTDFLNHILRLPFRFFETRATGDITARLSDGMQIQRAFIDGAGTALIDGVVVLGSIAFLLILSPGLGALALAAIPVYAMIVGGAARDLRTDHGQAMAAYAKVEGSYIDTLGSIEAIAGHGVAHSFVEANAGRYSAFQHRINALGIRHSRLSLLMDLCGGFLAILSLVWGAVLVLKGDLLVGGLIAGYTLLVGVLPSVGRIIQAFLSFQEAAIAASRLRDLLLTPTERWTGGEPMAKVKRVEVIRGRVAWSDGARPFEEISLELLQGEMVGLVGTNGCGKSTLTRILTRSIDLSGGSLLVNGSPADSASLGDYRARVVLLPNEVRIVSGTLADNVLFGRPVAGVEVLESLVTRIGLAGFMTRFRDRWATRIGEGGRRISSGERQIIGLMRALLFPPDLLIVDEGIGGTDEGHTSLVLEALRAFSSDRIVLIVSHDPRVLHAVDRLYRFEAGKLEPVSSQGRRDPAQPTPSLHPRTPLAHRRPYVIS